MSDLVAFLCGARGQGKTTQAKYYLAARRPARLLIFDPMAEYAGTRCSTLAELHRAARAAPEFALRYVPPRGTDRETKARFDALCSIAYELGDLTLLAEELQLVTAPSWAPPAWADCTLRGRHRRLSIIGLSQRPASVDKNFLSNCSVVSTGRLNYDDDVACMARMLGVPRERVLNLAPFAFLARDMGSGVVTQGTTAELLPTIEAGKPARRRARPQK